MKIVTHNAKFHPDDVFAVATLSILLGKENCEVTRTRDPELIASADYVVDVGQKYDSNARRFDHHQIEGAGRRMNGIPYASFGLVWKEYGAQISGSDKVAQKIDEALVQGIDAIDNGMDINKPLIEGVYTMDVSSIVSLYRPTWTESQDWDNNFAKALDWAINIIRRLIKVYKDSEEAEAKVVDIYNAAKDKKIVRFPKEYDFGRELISGVLSNFPEPVYAVLYRDDSDSWQVLAIRKEKGSFESKKPLPEAWRGKTTEEFNKATGFSDTIFCHRSGFMCVVKSQETAEALAQIALNA